MKSLCLNMIVKDEEANLRLSLPTLKPWIACYCIVDTGSTDGTKKVIAEIMQDVPGVVLDTSFVSFGETRTKAIRMAEEWLKRVPQQGVTHFLLCDADMELRVDDPKAFDNLTAALYLVVQKTVSGLQYDNARIVSVDAKAEYRGVTHEFLSVSTSSRKSLDGVWFFDRGTGSNRQEKAQRDIQMLLKGIETSDLVSRYVFYIAQSYKDIGDWDNAIMWYEVRRRLGGWKEELWYATYAQAYCMMNKGDRGFVDVALQATTILPRRAEAWMMLAQHYRSKGLLSMSYACAMQCADIKPSEFRLFVETAAYVWKPKREIALAAKAMKQPDLAQSESNEFLLMPNIPYYDKNLVRQSYDPLVLSRLCPSATFKKVDCGGAVGAYSHTNPSIIRRADGSMAMTVRTVNYQWAKTGGMCCQIKDGTGKISTKNYFVTWSGDYSSLAAGHFMEDRTGKPPPFDSRIVGYEDLRLFEWRDGLWAIGMSKRHDPKGHCQQVLLKLAPSGDYENITYLKSPLGITTEKNWMPLVRGDELFLVYSFTPRRVFRYNPETQALEVVQNEGTPGYGFEGWRGGSQVVEIAKDCYLAVIHEHVDYERMPRRYLSRFVMLDGGLRVLMVSPLLALREVGIEFVAGMAKKNDDLLVTFGHWDAEAYLMKVPLGEVLEIMKEVRG